MSTTRVLIVGHGSAGKRHLRLVRSLMPAAKILVLSQRIHEAVPDFADASTSSLARAVEFAPEFAVIANAASSHVGTAVALARVDTHLIIEKPLSNESEGTLELLEVCRRKGLALLVGYNLRYLPSLIKFRDYVREGLVGESLSIRCEAGQNLASWRPETRYQDSVSAQHALGGGVLLELSHEIDYLRWVFGEVDWVSAILRKQSLMQIDVEDAAHLTLGFSSSETGRQAVASVNLDFIRHDSTRSCTLIGERGSVRWNGLAGTVELLEVGDRQWREVFRYLGCPDESYIRQLEHFLGCVSGREVPRVTGLDALQTLRVVEAARQSSYSAAVLTKVVTDVTK